MPAPGFWVVMRSFLPVLRGEYCFWQVSPEWGVPRHFVNGTIEFLNWLGSSACCRDWMCGAVFSYERTYGYIPCLISGKRDPCSE